MTVQDIMKTDVATCAHTDDLSQPIHAMQQHHCGFVPVVGSEGTVTGVITDRDICLALAAHLTRSAARIAVADAMSHPVFSCFPEENLKVVLGSMAQHHVRRLPVLNKDGRLQGVLSIDDIVLAPRRRGNPTAEEIVDALKGIVAPRRVEAAVA